MIARHSFLQEVELDEGLERIDDASFARCGDLKRIKIPSTVEFIGRGAFEDCKRLAEVELNEGLEEIEKCALKITNI